jgi:hypothetical protein
MEVGQGPNWGCSAKEEKRYRQNFPVLPSLDITSLIIDLFNLIAYILEYNFIDTQLIKKFPAISLSC